MSTLVTDATASPGASVARVGLAIGGIVLAAVVIFGLGVMEGSRVASRVPVVAAPPSALPTETLKTLPAAEVAPQTPIPPDKLTFYDRLSGVAPVAPLALPEGRPPAQGLTPAAATESQGTPARQKEEAPVPPVPATAVPRKAPLPAATGVAGKTPAPSKADATAQIKKLAGKGRFTVQMAAVAERSAAKEMAALVRRNGFDAVTATVSVKGKLLYRIRVGSFPNKQAATQAAGIFRSAFGLEAIAMEK